MNRDDVASLHERLEEATCRAEAAEAELRQLKGEVTQLLAEHDRASVSALRLGRQLELLTEQNRDLRERVAFRQAALDSLRQHYETCGLRASEVVPMLRKLGLWPDRAREAQRT